MDITKVEYWLLWCAIEKWCDIAELLKEDDEVGDYFNRPPHKMSFDELFSTLDHLFSQGDIISMRWGTFGQKDTLFVPSTDEIKAALNGQFSLFWGLTEQGGKKWETFSNPNWDFYLAIFVGIRTFSLKSSNEDLLEAAYLAQFQEVRGVPVPETRKKSVMQPWLVNRWKTLPKGYDLTFAVSSELEAEKDNSYIPANYLELLRKAENWYTPYKWS